MREGSDGGGGDGAFMEEEAEEEMEDCLEIL